jgi:hypothetical protein
MHDRERYRKLLGVVTISGEVYSRKALFWVSLVAVLLSPLIAPSIRCLFKERWPMRDAEVGQAARELGRKWASEA